MPKSEITVLRGEARKTTTGLRVGSASEGGSLGANLDLPVPWGGDTRKFRRVIKIYKSS
jgi:hypothetical protein